MPERHRPGGAMSRPRRVAIVVGVVIAASVIFLLALSTAVGHEPLETTPVTRTALDAVRAKQIGKVEEASYDDGYETCIALGMKALAQRLEVTNPTPRTVARAFAQGYDPAFRRGPFQGCLEALGG